MPPCLSSNAVKSKGHPRAVVQGFGASRVLDVLRMLTHAGSRVARWSTQDALVYTRCGCVVRIERRIARAVLRDIAAPVRRLVEVDLPHPGGLRDIAAPVGRLVEVDFPHTGGFRACAPWRLEDEEAEIVGYVRRWTLSVTRHDASNASRNDWQRRLMWRMRRRQSSGPTIHIATT
eukprot:38231-Chlamydomonas_euryale.AAC.7